MKLNSLFNSRNLLLAVSAAGLALGFTGCLAEERTTVYHDRDHRHHGRYYDRRDGDYDRSDRRVVYNDRDDRRDAYYGSTRRSGAYADPAYRSGGSTAVVVTPGASTTVRRDRVYTY